MAKCEVIAAGRRHGFDSFECAIHTLAPVCSHCGRKVVGHGIEANDAFSCGAHRAREAGVTGVADRAEARGDTSPNTPKGVQ